MNRDSRVCSHCVSASHICVLEKRIRFLRFPNVVCRFFCRYRIMQCNKRELFCILLRPTPHGVGGLKFLPGRAAEGHLWSHPARGGWIEICSKYVPSGLLLGPTPHGAGGLKLRGKKSASCGTLSVHAARNNYFELNGLIHTAHRSFDRWAVQCLFCYPQLKQ